MEIYILRHGIAEEVKPGARDSDRALTAEGKRRLLPVLRRGRAADLNPDFILTSPYRRAVETAQVAAEALEVRTEPVHCPGLTPMSDPRAAWDEIRVHRSARQILVVGHEPLLSQLFAFLLGTPNAQIDLKKGSLARIDVEPSGLAPRGVLRWLLTPRLAGGR